MMLHFLNDIAYGAESIQKIENFFIITNLKREPIGKLMNRISGLGFFYIKFMRLGF